MHDEATRSGAMAQVVEQGVCPPPPIEPAIDFRRVFDLGHDMAAIADSKSGRIVVVNQVLVSTTAWSREELVGRHVCELHTPESQARLQEQGQRFLRSRRMGEGNLQLVHRDGHAIEVSMSVLPLDGDVRDGDVRDGDARDGASGNGVRDADSEWGAARYCRLEWHDVTRENQTKRDLRESEQMLRELVANIREVFWVHDSNTHAMLYISPAYERIWGRACQEIYQNPNDWLDSIHPDDRDRVQEAYFRTVGKSEYSAQYRILRSDGTMRWIWDRGFPIRNERGEIYRYGGFAEDITESKQAEETARRSERLASIGTLAAGIAHEINNPLGAMMLTAETAVRKLGKGETEHAAAAFEKILSHVERCREIVGSVLRLSRAEPPKRSRQNLVELVHRALDLTRGQAQMSGVLVELHAMPDTCELLLNPTEIEQVVVNLVLNAVAASPQGSEVRVGIEAASAGATLIVEDQGTGIAQEMRHRVFDPFFTTRVESGGTGLGLSIVHAIVRDHDGTIDVQSRPGSGTRVTVVFPWNEPRDGGEQA